MPLPKEQNIRFHRLIKDFGEFSVGQDLPKDEVTFDGGGVYFHTHVGEFIHEPIESNGNKYLVKKTNPGKGVYEQGEDLAHLHELKEV